MSALTWHNRRWLTPSGITETCLAWGFLASGEIDSLRISVIYTPPPIPVGLRLFQKVRSDSGRTNWIPVDSGRTNWIPVDSGWTNWNPVDSGGFQFVQLEMLDLEHYNG